MTWFGSPTYLAVCIAIAAVALLIDRLLLHAGQVERAPRLVPHRKLRAAAETRRTPATGVHAPSNVPVAGPDHNTLNGRSAIRASVERQPAPEDLHGAHPSGAGPQPLADDPVSASASPTPRPATDDNNHGAPRGDNGGPGHQQSVSVGAPDPALTGVQPRHPGEGAEVTGDRPAAASPSPVAAAPRSAA